MNKQWLFYKTNQDKKEEIAKKYNISKLLATVLVNRNIVEEEQIRTFLHPTRNDFHDPYLMPDMEIAVNRILKAIEQKQKIIIYGDYDVDGITSTTVLKSFLEERGIQVDTYIPNRLQEGYGLNNDAIKKIVEGNHDLMITVDCGISCIKEVDYANSLGLETIITDHHEPVEILPNAIAVVDAKRKDNTYPCRDLAGVGVVFKLIQAMSQKLNLDAKEYLKYLDLVCVGTISDIVPLIDENRVIAKLGLMLVNETKNLGLKSILNVSGYKKIDSNAISFGIAPRINASGRMGHQDEALKLFLSKNIVEVSELTRKLNEYNSKRQEIEKNIYNNVIKQIEDNNLENESIIIVDGENWHHGVIGIVSSKITDMYFKPSILLSFEDGIGTGSGRSIPGFDLHEALTKTSNNLDKYGGHAMAVGVTLKKENLKKFKNDMQEIAEESNIQEILPTINIDAQIQMSDITIKNIESIEALEPFGEGNKTPLFAIRNLKISSIRALTNGKHLKLALQSGNNIIDAIGFNLGNLVNEYKIGDKIDVVGIIEINSFNGVDNLQINIKDVMKSI